MKLNIKEKFRNSLLYKLVNGGTVEEQDIDTMTVSPDDAATLMALRKAEQETDASIANYKPGVGFVVTPEVTKTRTPRKTPKTRAKEKIAPVQQESKDKDEYEQEQ